MNEFKVGLMALATLASVVVMSFKITSNQSGFGDYVPYRTIVSDASGIFPKTPIKVAGINAGRIKNIELTGNQALITFEVLEDIKVPADSKLRIKTVGFLGDKYIEISVGKSQERLDSMGFLIAEEAGGMETLVKDAAEVLKDVREITKSVKDALAPEGQEPALKKIMQNVDEMVINAKDATASMKRVLGDNENKLNKMIDDLGKFSGELANQTNTENPESSLRKVKKILANLDDMTLDMKNLVADIKAGKGTVGKLLVEEEIADEVRATLAGVQKIVGKVDAIRTELELFTGANSDYGSESALALKIFPAPERFYLLGLVTSEIGPDRSRTIVSTVNGVETTENRVERDRDTYRFNIQIGRILGPWTFRGGIIESSGGLGVDYDVRDWGTRFKLEAFDYRKNIGINLRLSFEQQLWNVFYGRIAVEDSLEENRSATLSAGMRFNDEDLKGLIGFFF
ncbi:MAG: hypothetical protein CME71_08970 [Halobacteriovorax sp.]|nr:hypothetical protein [Halobacteriovorax sp.]